MLPSLQQVLSFGNNVCMLARFRYWCIFETKHTKPSTDSLFANRLFEICVAFNFYNCLLGKTVILKNTGFFFLLRKVLEKTKISKGILSLVAHWFVFVLTLVFRLPKAGAAEHLLILFLFNIPKISYFLALNTL